jgi:hypothetical protein
MKQTKLSELIEVLEMDSEDRMHYVDLQEGRVVSIEITLLDALDAGDDEELADTPDWQKEEVALARLVTSDSGERFVEAPDATEFHEYRHMERFIGGVEKSEDAEQLWRAIKGKGAFRYFKDTAARLGLLDRWFQYRDEAMKAFMEEWAKVHHVPYVDDLASRGPKV